MILLVADLTRPAAAEGPTPRLRLVSPDFGPVELRAAAETWRRGCPAGVGGRLPDLVVEGPGMPVLIRRRGESTSPNGRCGQTRLQLVAGRLIAAEIDVFARQSDGKSCLPLEDEIAHELGHVFGLHDDRRGPRGAIMGPRRAGERRQVTTAECADALASRRLRTLGEDGESYAAIGAGPCVAESLKGGSSAGHLELCDEPRSAEELYAVGRSQRDDAGGSGN